MQILIRAPEALKQELQKYAKKIGITMNALILQILWDWLGNKGGKAGKK